MAKKTKELTIEEKLVNALVPDWEQPYKLPENWCWTRLGEVYNLYTGNSINATIKAEKYTGIKEGLNYIATKDVGFNTKIEYENGVKIADYDRFKIAKKNTALMCIEGGSAGKKVGYLDENVCFGNKLCTFDSRIENNKLLFYYLLSNEFIMLFQKNHHGLIGGVSVAELKTIEVPFPPLAEQKRIVERIESLFSKLDEAKALAQSALDSFENRKSAILHKAFSGELTKKWREESGVEVDSWEEKTLSDISKGFKYGTSEKSEYSYTGIPVFRIPNITSDGLDFNDLKYLSHFNITNDNQIHEDDILIIRSNGSRDLVGKSVLVPKLNKEYAYASFLIRLKLNEQNYPKFIVLYLNSSNARKQMFRKAKSSAGINNINTKELGSIAISIPPLSEQQEIVRILDSIFTKETEAKELVSVIDKIELIKKTILSKAFRGELGTNDKEEESSVGLLREMLKGE